VCSDVLAVEIVHAPHSWVALPQAYVNAYMERLTLPVAFTLHQAGSSGRGALVSWQGDASASANAIEVPVALAGALELQSGDKVSLEVEANLPEASIVHVAAASKEDWAVIDVNAEHLTTAMLSQLKAVRVGDQVPVWIRSQSSVTVKVLSATPADAVVLTNGSIVSIQPPEEPAASTTTFGGANPTADNATEAQPQSPGTDAANGSDLTSRKNKDENVNAKADAQPVRKKVEGPLRLRVQVRASSSGTYRYTMRLQQFQCRLPECMLLIIVPVCL
jgi:antitoxin component of MazEF toxin-antitoxin module